MSYIDETYGKQLEEALRGLVSRPALGQPWFGFHASEVPAGVLLFTATTHSRVLYADFWKYIQDKNLVKTEEEWQSIYSEQGWCPFYSDGDGIDTFRMPILEESEKLIGIWAISAPQQPIPDATVEGIISGLSVASNNALEAKNGLNKAMPVGTVIAFSSNSTPDGFLLCNGAAVSRTTYAKLFETIGTTYGAGDGSNTFNLPNLTDKFIQGSGTAGTVKAAGLPNIHGRFAISRAHHGITINTEAFKATKAYGSSATASDGSGVAGDLDVQFWANDSNAIYGASSTVQPPALTMRYYIKY